MRQYAFSTDRSIRRHAVHHTLGKELIRRAKKHHEPVSVTMDLFPPDRRFDLVAHPGDDIDTVSSRYRAQLALAYPAVFDDLEHQELVERWKRGNC